MAKYPMIGIVGASGTGKSSSLRNLPKERTKILNIEQKFLPFKSALEYSKNDMWLKSSVELDAELFKSISDKSFDILVIESFTSYSESLIALAKRIKTGWDIYTFYVDKVIDFIEKLKAMEDKWIIFIATDELLPLDNPNGTKVFKRRISFEGKVFEKKPLDKNFTLVLFTDIIQSVDKTKFSDYKFLTTSDGTTTAKTPNGMFSTVHIDNDIYAVIKACEKYYNFPAPNQFVIK